MVIVRTVASDRNDDTLFRGDGMGGTISVFNLALSQEDIKKRHNFGVCVGGGDVLAVVAKLFETDNGCAGWLLGAGGVGNDIGGFCGGEFDF